MTVAPAAQPQAQPEIEEPAEPPEAPAVAENTEATVTPLDVRKRGDGPART
jgi:hypothetical protein